MNKKSGHVRCESFSFHFEELSNVAVIGTCFTGLPGARGPSWAPHAVFFIYISIGTLYVAVLIYTESEELWPIFGQLDFTFLLFFV